jgi:hypothetical protein
MPIYFSGVLPPQRDDVDLARLQMTDPVAYEGLFTAWMIRTQLAESAVSTDLAALSTTERQALEGRFRVSSWNFTQGVTAEEVVLWLQITMGKRLSFVVNEDVPREQLDHLEHVLPASGLVLAACVVRHLYMKRRGTLPVLLSAGGIAHAISARSVDPSMLWVGYDDQLWRTPGKSFLSLGENPLGIDAQYCGRSDIGQWVTSTAAISGVIFGVPILTDDAATWSQWIVDARAQLTGK